MLTIGVLGSFDSALKLGEIISRQPACKLIGIYDPDPDLTRPLPGNSDVPFFTSFQAFLSRCNAVIVERSEGIRSGHIIEALRGSKHVLLDKSLDLPDKELDYLYRLADEADTLLKIREPFLFHPVIKAAKPLIHSPAFIDYQIGISADTDSDRLPDLITGSIFQCLDAILFLNPGHVARSNTLFSPDLFGFPGVIHGRLEFDNGCISNITCNGYAEQEKTICYLYQENRHIMLNFINHRLLVKDRLPGKEKPNTTSIPTRKNDPVAEEIKHFTELIISGNEHLESFYNSCQSLMLGRKMLQNLPLHPVHV